MKPIKAGALGKEIYAAADAVLHKSKLHNHIHFLAHGMGLVSHEAPRLTNSGPVPYDAYDADRPLETGMVVSVETTLQHPRRGFIKLEDTVIVTPGGFEIYGDRRPRLEFELAALHDRRRRRVLGRGEAHARRRTGVRRRPPRAACAVLFQEQYLVG